MREHSWHIGSGSGAGESRGSSTAVASGSREVLLCETKSLSNTVEDTSTDNPTFPNACICSKFHFLLFLCYIFNTDFCTCLPYIYNSRTSDARVQITCNSYSQLPEGLLIELTFLFCFSNLFFFLLEWRSHRYVIQNSRITPIPTQNSKYDKYMMSPHSGHFTVEKSECFYFMDCGFCAYLTHFTGIQWNHSHWE